MADPGVISDVAYGWETAYPTLSTQINKAFGHGVTVPTMPRRNNIEAVYSAGARNAQKLIPKKYEGSITVEFVLSSPSFLRGLMGSASVASSAPTIHTFAEADTIESFSIKNNVYTDTKSVPILRGCKIQQMVLTSAIGELVKVRLDCPYATEDFSSTTAALVSETLEPMIFSQGTLELPDGSTIAKIQNIELTVTNSVELVYQQGSRFAVAAPVKNRIYTARVTANITDSSLFLERLYGSSSGPVAAPAETATMEILFDNGLTQSSQRQVSFVFTGVQLDEHNLPQDPTALIIEDMALLMRSAVITAKNNVTEVQ